MTGKALPSKTKIRGKNVERTKQVPYEHYDILLPNKLLLVSAHSICFWGAIIKKQYLVWFPSGALVL